MDLSRILIYNDWFIRKPDGETYDQMVYWRGCWWVGGEEEWRKREWVGVLYNIVEYVDGEKEWRRKGGRRGFI